MPINNNFLNLLFIRVKTAAKIIFCPKLHWIFIPIEEDKFISHLQENDIELDVMAHRLVEYNVKKLLASFSVDEVDLILSKAELQAKSELLSIERKKNSK